MKPALVNQRLRIEHLPIEGRVANPRHVHLPLRGSSNEARYILTPIFDSKRAFIILLDFRIILQVHMETRNTIISLVVEYCR